MYSQHVFRGKNTASSGLSQESEDMVFLAAKSGFCYMGFLAF